jgi:asparagine synthase (glutamine-hydrolysing)
VRVAPGPSFLVSFVSAGRGALAGTSDDPGTWIRFDADACTLDGAPLVTPDDWWRVVRADALDRVDGSFVLAWRTAGDTCLARDAIGHRSLYYTESRGRLVFASSLRALLDRSGIARQLNLRSLAAYLAYAYVPGRDTLVEGAFEVLPGERVTLARGELTRRAFWELPPEPEAFAPEGELEARLRSALEATVSGLLPRGAPVAASLSGGIDSSLIVALAARLHDAPVATFSITFGAEYKDELPFSSLVAAHCGTRHHVVEITPEAVAAHVDDTMALLSKPNGDPLTVPNALLFREMARHARVALNGEGGDPCFGGPKNLPMVLAELYGHDAEPGASRERSYLRAHQKCSDELDALLEADAHRCACTPPLESDLTPWFEDGLRTSLVGRLMAINVRFKGGHHILPKVEALSAPFDVLARSPLFARSIVELAFAIPSHLKLRGADEKHLLKRAVRDLVPDAILERPKSGMMVPVEGWFQGPLLPQARARILEGLAPSGLFRRQYLEDLLSGKIGGLRPRRGVKIWLLVTLEAHLRSLGITYRR